MIKVTLHDDQTGKTQTVELPSDDFVVVACTWTQARQTIAGHLACRNGIMRHWRAEELADQAVEALASSPDLLLPTDPS